jgi:hypothetical protein
MRILGPDGRPLNNEPPVKDEVRQIVEQSRALAAQGDPQTALQQLVLAFQQDVTSDLVLNATCELLAHIAHLAGSQPGEELQLFDAIRKNREDAAAYYQLGNRFFQLQQAFIARPFLLRARELQGPTVNELTQAIDVDLAQTIMDLGDYEGAISAFHTLNDTYGGLPIWLVLEMAECYALLGQIDEAEQVYQITTPESAAEFPGMEEVREEVGDLLARVRDFEPGSQLQLREWHYVQTRGIIIETNADENVPGERFVGFQPSEEEIAYVVGTAAALLDAREYAPTRLLWLGESSEPLARLFAQWWEIDEANIRAYRPGDNSDNDEELTLLCMSHSYDVTDEETYQDLVHAQAGLIVFALDLRWTERQPMTPDIAGFMTQMCNLPWEPRLQVSDDGQTVTQIQETRDAQTIALEIGAMFNEDECDETAHELIDLYAPCTDLILDHRDGSLIRRSLATHSPVKSPKFGF